MPMTETIDQDYKEFKLLFNPVTSEYQNKPKYLTECHPNLMVLYKFLATLPIGQRKRYIVVNNGVISNLNH